MGAYPGAHKLNKSHWWIDHWMYSWSAGFCGHPLCQATYVRVTGMKLHDDVSNNKQQHLSWLYTAGGTICKKNHVVDSDNN